MIRKIIEITGSLNLAKYLLAGLAAVFFTGSIYYNINNEIFIPLNYKELFEWLVTYGFENPQYTWWFFVFIALMVVLGINTFACTLNRLIKILTRFRKVNSAKKKLYLLSPHIMHLSFIILMLGYFILYAFGINTYNNILRPGMPYVLPGTDVKMEIKGQRFFPNKSELNEMLKGMHLDTEFDLAFTGNGKETVKTVGLNRPCFFNGYSIHIAEFNPKSVRGMTKTVWLNLTIRKNAGIPLFITGVMIFIIGVILYAGSAIEKNKTKNEVRD